jgi:hypothetical protein
MARDRLSAFDHAEGNYLSLAVRKRTFCNRPFAARQLSATLGHADSLVQMSATSPPLAYIMGPYPTLLGATLKSNCT